MKKWGEPEISSLHHIKIERAVHRNCVIVRVSMQLLWCSLSLPMQTPESIAIAAIHGPSSFSSSFSSSSSTSSPSDGFSSERGKVDPNSEQGPPSATTALAKNEVGITVPDRNWTFIAYQYDTLIGLLMLYIIVVTSLSLWPTPPVIQHALPIIQHLIPPAVIL